MRSRRGGFLLGIVAGCAVLVAGCATEPPATTLAVETSAPTRTVTPTVDQTRASIVTALGAQNLVLTDSQAPVRPAEAPLFAAAPRAVYQVTLPQDPDKGFLVVYEFPDTASAAAAAAEEQAYLATGPGRVQTPQGTVTVIRQVGSTIVFYQWLPGAAKDPAAPGIESSLESLGVGFPIAN